VGLAIAAIGLGVAIRDYQDRKEKEALEMENLRLENERLKKQLDNV